MSDISQSPHSRKLIRYGVLLFLLGLITGLVIPAMQNPRMGLSSHLEGVMNGMFLIILGLIWSRLNLSQRVLKWGYGLALFGTFTNWITTFLAGVWGAGAAVMPFAGGDFHGDFWQELIIQFGLLSLSLAMIIVCGLLFWGLRGKAVNSR